jgi:ABC-type transporter Mla subunit MlaD
MEESNMGVQDTVNQVQQAVTTTATQVAKVASGGFKKFIAWLGSFQIGGLGKFILFAIIVGLGVFGYVQTTRINHINALLDTAVRGTKHDAEQFATTIAGLNKQIDDGAKLDKQYQSTIDSQQQSISGLKSTIAAITKDYKQLVLDFGNLQAANSAIGNANSAISGDASQARDLINGAISELETLKSAVK